MRKKVIYFLVLIISISMLGACGLKMNDTAALNNLTHGGEVQDEVLKEDIKGSTYENLLIIK